MRRIGYFCVTFFRSRLRSCVLTRDDPSAFAPPSAFGPFRVLHQIGVGALGPVFRTYEPTRDRLVAVKVFRLDITPEQAQALAAELARAAEAGLFHPSIVEPLAAGVEGTVAYRAEEYVAAESLDVAMRHYAPASLDKVLPFITQLAGAIDFARAAGVGHGALHPRDIFVTPDEARATGFGVVDALERVGLRAPVRRPYSPPERIAGEKWSTPADVFSLAAIAFELLTGRRPSGTGDQIGSLTGAPADQAGALRDVLARAMHEDPAARYPSALAFAAALESGAQGVGDAAAPVLAVPAPPAIPAAAAISPLASEPAASPEQPSGAASSASAIVPASVSSQAPGEPDDVAAEREEDEWHWNLSREEAKTAEVEADEPAVLFAAGETERAADELMLDAADLALGEGRSAGARDERFVSEFADESLLVPYKEPDVRAPKPERAKPPAVVPLPIAPSHPAIPKASAQLPLDDDLRLAEETRGDFLVPERAAPTSMLPLTLTLLVGLLIGFVAAYAVLSRPSSPDTVTTQQVEEPAAPDSSPTGSTGAPAGREYSEGTVAQPRPPATPPDVPAEGTGAESRPPAATPAVPDKPAPVRAPPRSGRVVVRSTPAGASVTVNGRWRGRTPLTLDELTFADYVVRIVQPGYEVASEAFKLTEAQATRTVSHRLVRTPASRRDTGQRATAPPPAAPVKFIGSIFVDSRPRGAKVFVDGKELGTTPLRLPEIAIGAHVVRLELADHRTWTNGIRVTAGQEVRVTGSLEPIR